MSNFRMLSFDAGGVKTDLLSDEDCQEAIEDGRLKADTQVVVYYSDGKVVSEVAGECTALSHLFAAPEDLSPEPEPAPPPVAVSEPEPEPEPDPEQRAPQVSEPVTARPAQPELGALPKPEITTELDDRQPQASDSPEQVQRSGVPVSLVAILLMVTAAFVAIFASAWSSDPGGGEDAQVVSVYVSGRANARDQPTAEGSSILATYDVGTELTGTWVSGASDASEQWLKFEVDGQTRYIWSRNLSVVRSDVPSENEKEIASIDPAEAVDFVKKYVFANNSSSGLWASDVVNTYYDDQVLYFGKTVDRSYVMGEKVRYERRWPDRTYQIMEDTVQTDCQTTPGVCSISGTMWYSATSKERGAHGEGYAEFTLGVKMTTSGLRISSETGKVVGN